jgi:photosystem II stability/assembly factor-like uncharacterized protein
MKTSLLSFFILFISTICLGQDWIELPNSPVDGTRFDDICFLNEDLGWAANGGGGSVWKTTDGGLNWQLQFEDSGYFRNIEFLNENVGFLGTLNNKFYTTTNGGDDWELVPLDPNVPAICGMDAVGESTIFGVGAYFSPAYLIKSTDGGQTFTYKDMSEYTDGLVEILMMDEFHGYTSGRGYDGGVILETFDGGDTWTEIFNTGFAGEYVWKLQVRDEVKIFASVESTMQGKLVKSFDGGNTWETKSFPDNSVQAVGFISDTRGWMGGHNTGFYETNDGGDTWESLNLGASLNRFVFLSDNLIYCAGTKIYKYDMRLGVSEFLNSAAPDDLKVTIAPMPVQDQLNVLIEFEHIDNVLIELYDAQGKFIKRLIRDRVNVAQQKEYSFDFPYATGTYILDIHTNYGKRQKTLIKI